MVVTILIYLIIISLIIFKGFYRNIFSIKSFSIGRNTESLLTSIQIESLPFYFSQGKINLFVFFINFLFLSFISLTFLPDLIYNQVTFCMDHENTNFNHLQRFQQTNLDNNKNSYIYLDKIIEKTYGVFNKNFPFEEKLMKDIHTFGSPFYIYYLNNCDFSFLGPSYLEIQDYDKIFEGVSKDIDNILDKQNSLLQKIFTSSITLNNFKSICENIMERNENTLNLISRAYDHMILLYKDSDKKIHNSDEFDKLFNKILDQKMSYTNIPKINLIIKDFIGDYDYQVENLNKKVTNVFITLKEVYHISKENYSILNRIIDKPPIDTSNSNGNPWLCQEYRKQINIFYKNWNGNQILDNNIPIIRVLNLPEEIQNKNYDELRGYASFKDYNSSNYIKKNIYDFCRKRPYEPLTSGFKFRDNSIVYTKRYSN